MSPDPISTQLGGLSLGAYTGEEIKTMSVCSITTSLAIDSMGMPVSGSYYDARMGPLKKGDRCVTCGLQWRDCPGHMGCIELATMVYNPTFFTCLSRLLSRKCVFCHKLRCLEALVTKCEAQLLLLDAGLVVECGELCSMDVKNQTETSAALAKYCSKAHDAIATRGSAAPQTHTIRQMRDQAYSQLIHAAGGAVCHNCGMASPTLRVQTGLKIFRKILSATHLKRNAEHTASEQDLKRLEASDALDELDGDVTKWDPEAGGASGMVYVPPFEAYEELRRLWRQHPTLTDLLFGTLQPLAGAQPHALPRARSSPEAFFITVLAVAPNRIRPLIMLNGKMVDNPINVVLTRIITTNAELRTLSALHGADAPARQPSQPYEHEHEHDEGPLPEAQQEKFLEHSLALQRSVNNLLDSTKAYDSQALPGIRQGLERKEGLFRMHVQGKRGNYAARSVIAPDPNLLTSEIGIPDVFARTLTFKEPVTRGNVDFMRKLVLNGPTYPGANSIQFENGMVKSLVDMPYNDRKVLADSLLVDTSAETADRGEARGLKVRTGRFSFNTLQPKVVSRHVLPGDPLILNRQPSLHRSSMLVHRARILPGHAKVIRFHFANCEALNADFDGDECNLYYPQTLPGVAEAEELVLNDRHYVTPTFGEPIRGLIQDHVIGGVLLCRVDAFRGRHEFLAEVAYACETRGFLGADDRRAKDQRLLGVEALNRVYTDNVFSAVNDLKFLGAVYTRADLAVRPSDDDAADHAAGVTPSDLFKTPQSSLSERVLFRSNGDGFGGMREHYGRRAAAATAAATAAGASTALRDGRCNAFRTRKATVIPDGAAVAVPPPAIAYPCPTWTGKQVVTAMLNTVADGREPLHYTGATRVPAALWGPFQATEGRVRIIANELVTGLIEKKHIAAADKGLVHGIFELYGHAASGLFLSNYGRLATHELQKHGLTCSLEDMILSGRAERARQKIYQQVLHAGPGVAQRFLLSSDAGAATGAADAADAVDERAICKAIRHTNLVDDALYARFDATMSSEASNLTSSLIKACSPGNLVLRCHSRLSSGTRYRSQKTFNSLAYMIMSGSKGSTVNLQMMTTCLGQQALEGRRVPMTAAGRTLPCFSPYASVNFVPGGYVYDRFLTGIRPSSFFFHCQAGREGLIDTAVKTATSGYFQRVMIKNLEGLTVRYDGTVRDGDGSLVQTLYGGDAVDTCRRSYLHAFDFVRQNLGVYSRALLGPAAHAHEHEHERGAKALLRRLGGDAVRHLEKFLARCASADVGRGTDSKERRRLSKTLRSLLEAAPGLLAAHGPEDAARGEDAAFSEYDLAAYYHGLAKLPLQSLLSPYRFLGSVSSVFQEDLRCYVAARRAEDAAFDGEFFATLMRLKYMQSLIAPGEAVGLIASQSIGEPATQLTLNTFHLAGHGGANVTLGIPRLRELVMTASRAIKTPLMCIRLAGGAAPRGAQEQAALRLVGRLQRIRLSEVVATIDIAETVEGGAKHHYVSLGLLRGDDLLSQHNLSCLNLKKVLVTRFVREFTKYADQALGAQQSAGVPSIIQSVAVLAEAAPARGPGGPDGDNAPDGEGNACEGREASASDDSDSESADPDAKGAPEDSEPDQDASEEDAAARDTSPGSGSGSGSGSDSDSEGSGSDATGPGARAAAGRKPLAFDSEWVESSKQIDFLVREAVNSEKGAIHIRDISFKVVDGVPVFLVHSQVEITDRLLISTLTERAVKATTIRAISGISRCFARFDKDLDQFVVDVEGSNLLCPRMLPDECVDLDSLYCNDIHAILRTYGVEAARSAIIAEMSKVFSVYHIDVDFRHLSIVADYMTQQGAYTPLNRAGIVTAPSVMQKASFETSVRFLSDGAIFGSFDNLQGLSGAVTTGQEAALGTGAFEVLQPVE